MKLIKSAEMFRHQRMGLLKYNHIDAFIKPKGVVCQVTTDGENTYFVNGKSRFINDEISKQLIALGIRGDVIIHHTSMDYGMPRWLTYKLHHDAFDTWKNEVIFYTFKPYKVESDLRIESLHKLSLTYDEISGALKRQSENASFDGLIAPCEYKDGSLRYFHILPTRYATGTIVSSDSTAEKPFIIVESVHNGETCITKITRFTKKFNGSLMDWGKRVDRRRVKIQYSTYNKGDRICNIPGATALFIINEY